VSLAEGVLPPEAEIMQNMSDCSVLVAGNKTTICVRPLYFCKKSVTDKHSFSTEKSSFTVVKQPGRDSDHSPPSFANIKRYWLYISTPLMSS
jgi:hypothetical protein